MTPNHIDLLESVLAKTEAVIAGVKPDQAKLATPCPDISVGGMVDHLVGWITSFSAKLNGETFDGNPNDFKAGADPATEFRAAGDKIVAAYRSGREETAQMPIGMLLIEYVSHGWDLAKGSNQMVEYSTEEAQVALETANAMIKDEHRGSGQPFGHEFGLRRAVNPVEELIAFTGRNPDWAPTSASMSSSNS